MKKWKPMFWKFLWGHGPQFSPWGRRRVTMDFRGAKLKISQWVFHHKFAWSRSFWIYLRIWDWMGKNRDNAICGFWSTTKLGFGVAIGWTQNHQNGCFLMCSPWIIELKTYANLNLDDLNSFYQLSKPRHPLSSLRRWRVSRR